MPGSSSACISFHDSSDMSPFPLFAMMDANFPRPETYDSYHCDTSYIFEKLFIYTFGICSHIKTA